MNFDNVQRGLIQKRRVFNSNPQGIRGFALNTRQPPLDDIRVRKALALLLNREEIIQKIMFNEFQPLNSYFVDTPYENSNNPKNEYDPQQALKLLAAAGWNSRDDQGRLVKNGVPMQLELLYYNKDTEPELTIYQEDLRKVGLTLNLRLVTYETQFQFVSNRKFQMAHLAWGGLLFPNPETQFLSSLADVNDNDNITGFKNARVDQICAAYDKMFDVTRSVIRAALLQQIDGIVANDYQYILALVSAYTGIAYWNKFGTAARNFTRTSDVVGSLAPGIPQVWWIDPAKAQKLQKALRDSSVKLDIRACRRPLLAGVREQGAIADGFPLTSVTIVSLHNLP